MVSKTRSRPVDSSVPAVTPDPITGPVDNGASVAPEADLTPARVTGKRGTAGEETRGGRFRRKAHRAGLHGYAIAAVVLVAYLIALAVSNTGHVKVSWVFGGSHVSLVWLVLFTAILGWLLGLATSARFQWRTRAPRRRGGQSS